MKGGGVADPRRATTLHSGDWWPAAGARAAVRSRTQPPILSRRKRSVSRVIRATWAAHQPAADRVEQRVGRGMQQQPDLVGPEAMTGQPVGKAGPFQVLDPVLGLAAIDIPVVEVRGASVRVVTTKRVLVPFGQHLGLHDHPARMGPAGRPDRSSPPAAAPWPRPGPGLGFSLGLERGDGGLQPGVGPSPMV